MSDADRSDPHGSAQGTSAGPAYFHPWVHALAIAVMLATFVLLLAGANVTSKDAGMAVPDWPTSFGSVNPEGWTSNMGGERPGVRDEHGHRLIGALVGVMVTALAVWLVVRDPRRWVKAMAVIAWFAVAIQGVMGGLRVLENSVALAIVHGVFAQMFFCLSVALVVVTSRFWAEDLRQRRDADGSAEATTESAGTETALVYATWATVGVILVQLLLGAIMRHTGWTWIPHMAWAFVVGLALMTIARYVFSHPYARRALSSAMVTLLVLYAFQIVLGLVTLIVVYPMWTQGVTVPQNAAQDWLPTIHMGVGAAILGTTAYLAVRASGIARQSGEVRLAGRVEGVPA